MPLFLLRDGSIRRCSVVPPGLTTCTFTDRYNREVFTLLDARSERVLLAAQAGRRTCRRSQRAVAAPAQERAAA